MSKTVAELLAERSEDQIKSSVPLEQLNRDEKMRRYEALRKKMGRSRLAVIGKAGIHYFWADHSDTSEMAMHESWGYTLVREPDAAAVMAGTKKSEISANGLKQDGTYVVGDVILMQCDMETYEFLMLANAERHEELSTGAQRDFRSEAEKLAVPVFDHIK